MNELLTVKVARKTQEAIGIASFELVDPEGKALPAFTAGSHIDIHIPGEIIRQYSIWNAPSEIHRYCLGILNDPESRGGSKGMHENVCEGDLVQISKPRNNFHLVDNAEYSMLFAGGIGITPIICMAQRLQSLGRDFELHYCSRSEDRAAFLDLLENSPFSDKIHYHFDNGDKDQLLNIPGLLNEQPKGANLYVCGPGGFMDAVIKGASNWDSTMVHREYFNVDQDHENDARFQVKLASTGLIYDIPCDETIIEVLGEEGIEIPVSCEQGVCGTCKTKVLDGEIDHRDVYLSQEDKDAGDQILPCCSRGKGLLILDI